MSDKPCELSDQSRASTGNAPSLFPNMIITNPIGVYIRVVIMQFINFLNMSVYKLAYHNQLIIGSHLGDDNLVNIGG